MTGEKPVREECKEPVFYTIDCNREELMELLRKVKKPKTPMQYVNQACSLWRQAFCVPYQLHTREANGPYKNTERETF